jgi:hypothetical protein
MGSFCRNGSFWPLFVHPTQIPVAVAALTVPQGLSSGVPARRIHSEQDGRSLVGSRRLRGRASPAMVFPTSGSRRGAAVRRRPARDPIGLRLSLERELSRGTRLPRRPAGARIPECQRHRRPTPLHGAIVHGGTHSGSTGLFPLPLGDRSSSWRFGGLRRFASLMPSRILGGLRRFLPLLPRQNADLFGEQGIASRYASSRALLATSFDFA